MDSRPSPAPCARRSADGGRANRAWNTALQRRTLEKPLANATSASGSAVSWRSCLASASRRDCASSTGETPISATIARRRWRPLTPSSAARSSADPSFIEPASMRATAAAHRRETASTGPWPGDSSGRQRKQARNAERSASAAVR